MRFIKSIRYCLRKLREASKNRNVAFSLAQAVSSQEFAREFALFDPNDPSVIYVNQPPVQGPPPGGMPQPGFA